MVHIVENIPPALTNQDLALKWNHEYVSVGWWVLGHRTWIKVRPYLHGCSYLQPGTYADPDFALTW